MAEEVKLDIYGARTDREARRAQPLRGGVEGHMSPLRLMWAEGLAELSDDLRVHVQRVACFAPLLVRQCGPVAHRQLTVRLPSCQAPTKLVGAP